MYKAVFLDLDDTLLDDKKEISNENIDAIKYVKEKGGFVFIASGRSIEVTKKYHNMIEASRYIIYSNGAGIFDCDANEKLFSADIEKQICLDLYRFAIENNYGVRIDTPYGRYINDKKYAIKHDIILEPNEGEKIIFDNDVLQISLLTEIEDKRSKSIDFVKNSISTNVKIENIFKTGIRNEFFAINIVNKNVSKGNAISGLCKYLKINVEDVIAIGDGANDISMLNAVGLGIAMGNGKPELKAIAKEITTTNLENGVAKVLKEKF